MILKQYKLQLEFTMNIQELSEEIVHKSNKFFSNYDEIIKEPEVWKRAEQQKKLLHALLADSEILERFVEKTIAGLFEAYSNEQVQNVLGTEESEEDILLPIINTLNPEDSKIFINAIENDLFSENTSELNECFTLELTNSTIVETV